MAYKITQASMTPKKKQSPVQLDHVLLQPFFNKIYMMKSDCFFNISGPDEVPFRFNTFYISELNKEIKTDDLFKIFSPIGKVRFQWMDDSSVFVIFDVENEMEVLPIVMELKVPFKIIPYSAFVSKMKLGSVADGSPFPSHNDHPRKRPLMESPASERTSPARKKFREGSDFLSPECRLI